LSSTPRARYAWACNAWVTYVTSWRIRDLDRCRVLGESSQAVLWKAENGPNDGTEGSVESGGAWRRTGLHQRARAAGAGGPRRNSPRS
jgi:hypothetical protein